MKRFFAAALAAAMPSFAQSQAQSDGQAQTLILEIDPVHSSVQFAVKHMMVSTVRGSFAKDSGTVKWNRQDPSKSAVDGRADAASIDTHNEKRDAHLKSAEFFDVQRCPEIAFKSTKVEKAGGDKYKVTGDLTMRCTTKPVTLDATFVDKAMKSPFGTMVYAASASGRIKRSDWGLIWNKTLESGGVMVSDEVDLNLDFELFEKQAEAKKQAQGESKSATSGTTK